MDYANVFKSFERASNSKHWAENQKMEDTHTHTYTYIHTHTHRRNLILQKKP